MKFLLIETFIYLILSFSFIYRKTEPVFCHTFNNVFIFHIKLTKYISSLSNLIILKIIKKSKHIVSTGTVFTKTLTIIEPIYYSHKFNFKGIISYKFLVFIITVDSLYSEQKVQQKVFPCAGYSI
jgi:hypothetical protein